ncbi:MAG: VIT family protein [Proteobacteria bacterium]|nr:VIT family protein [Pseudomonadota bacterium]
MRIPSEGHRIGRTNWLRAAVLGANDGILSTSSLLVGVAAASASSSSLVVAGAAALVAGAFSMGAGEYVSVSSQADLERADLAVEARELKSDPVAEEAELAWIYRRRGLSERTARQVARELMASNALDAHARDELGIAVGGSARPMTAALSSAASFAAGAALPLGLVLLAPAGSLIPFIVGAALACLGFLGAASAIVGGAPVWPAVLRVVLWGALAMGATGLIGHLTGHTAT